MELATHFHHLRYPTLLRLANYSGHLGTRRKRSNYGLCSTLDNHAQSIQSLGVFSLRNVDRAVVLGGNPARARMPD